MQPESSCLFGVHNGVERLSERKEGSPLAGAAAHSWKLHLIMCFLPLLLSLYEWENSVELLEAAIRLRTCEAIGELMELLIAREPANV
jgi:hypothetical protein